MYHIGSELQEVTCVIVDGPEELADGEPRWYVSPCGDDGEPVGEYEICFSYTAAIEYGKKLAERLGVEYVNEACDI